MTLYFNAKDIKRDTLTTITLANGLEVALTRLPSGSLKAIRQDTGAEAVHDTRGVRIALERWEAEELEAEEVKPKNAGHVVGYIRVSTKGQSVESQRDAIQAAYGDIKLYIDHGVSGTVPALEREALGALLKHTLRSGDTLVVWWIDRLGRNYDDVQATIQSLLKAGVTIKTINQQMTFTYGGGTQERMLTDVMLSMLVGMAEAERVNRLASAEAGRQALKADPKAWAEKFAGRKKDDTKRQAILEALLNGGSVRGVAAELGVSTSTVTLVKREAKEAGTVFPA